MPTGFEPALLEGISVYQDVVLGGQTVVPGRRDCEGRWAAIDPHLPREGTVLDIGSNFGWFGLRVCETRPQCVVASVEADERSARVQREVLHGNQSQRICLLTARAGFSLASRFAASGQRFDAVLCLSVLHWIADHRRFLDKIGGIAGRIFVEQPDPREDGAGLDSVRNEIGQIGDYLKSIFPYRPVECLGQVPSHRESEFPRELWMVGPADTWEGPWAGLQVSALLGLSPGWPPRSWWQSQLADRLTNLDETAHPAGLLLTPEGLKPYGRRLEPVLDDVRRRVQSLPESDAFTTGRRFYLRTRRTVGNALRWARLRSN